MAITLNGTTGIAVPLGTAAAPGVVNTTSATTGIYNPTSTSVAIATNGTAAMTIDASQVITGTAGNLLLVQGTSRASTSGTSIDFTSIPSWVKRITVMFSAVSSNGTGTFQIQLGTTSSIEITGYSGAAGVMVNTATSSVANISTGFGIYNGGTTYSIYGNAIITLLDLTTNLWCYSFSGANGNTANVLTSGGTKALASTLTRIKIIASATGSASDTFDAGTINIQYE